MTTHGEQRLGLLTSSKARVIMHGSQRAWETLRRDLWAGEAADFDNKVQTGARAYGHEHEAEGAAKFWERHPDVHILDGGFHVFEREGHPLSGWIASSPDRLIKIARTIRSGLEIKSPTSVEKMDDHPLAKHYDQCQHGMLATGLKKWWLVVHHGDEYVEHEIKLDREWQDKYLQRAIHFHSFCYEGKPVKRRKLSALDL